MYTVPQTAEILKLTRQRIYQLVGAGEIVAEILPGGRYKNYRISEEALNDYLAKKDPEEEQESEPQETEEPVEQPAQ